MLDLRQEAKFVEGTQQDIQEETVTTEAAVKPVVEITEEQINEWKLQWGKVYKTTVDGEDFIWRKLRRNEYVTAMGLEIEEGELAKNNIYYRQEFIANTITLFPTDMPERLAESAGLATAIADAAIDVAGFSVQETKEL